MNSTDFHTIRFDPDRCGGCMACMRTCPTQAIRVRGGSAAMLKNRCIDCGECFKVCPAGAVVPQTDTMADLSRFEYKIAIVSPTLYVQFDKPATPGVILEALKRCGFDEAVSLSRACDEVTVATELYVHEFSDRFPLISTFCPAVIRLIQFKYPDLVDQLLPLLSPREYAAKAIRRERASQLGLPEEKIGTVYITPCSAKLASIFDHPGMEASYLGSALAVRDVIQLLPGAISAVLASGGCPEERVSSAEIGWALLWSLPRSVPVEFSMSVAGLYNVIRILDDVEKGRLRDYAFIECHACPEGCVSGALTVENPYVARARAIHLAQSLPPGDRADRAGVENRYAAGDYFWQGRPMGRPVEPLDRDISAAIAKMKARDRIASTLPGIDCGACGAPTCRTFAEDVATGQAGEDYCVFLRERRVAEAVEGLASLVHLQDGKDEPRSRGIG